MTDPLPSSTPPILVTGCAGFIGFHLAQRLLDNSIPVIGIDNLDDYYDVTLKEARLQILRKHAIFQFHLLDLIDYAALENLFQDHKFVTAVHLAAQPGVRYSLLNPRAYLNSNITAFFNILEAARHHRISHLIYASSSSVYGLNAKMPFSVHDNVDHPISFYAASKKADELLAHTYSHLFDIPTTGLRFFTAYGPWYRPDMALFKFSRAIYLGEPLTLYNYGNMRRDFTYIDDIVDGILGVFNHPPAPNAEWSRDHPDPGSSPSPYKVYNIGAGQPVDLMHFLGLIEKGIGKKAVVNLAPMQPGDIPASFADISDLTRDTGYQPKFSVEEGIQRFLDWFLDYYGSGRPIPKSD
jgi:UDP-glucuronate 4-epimerase